jgi:membrane-associated phospholipid phosphatase
MAFCYFISYVLYFAMPAVGPRFTLHTFSELDTDLPGVFLTSLLRSLVNAGGGITWLAPDPVSIVNRDCMPSGHTMLTLVNIVLGFRNRSRFRWWFLVVGGSLIFSTVYLRYHYVVDVLVGAVLMVMTLPLEPLADRWIRTRIAAIRTRVG